MSITFIVVATLAAGYITFLAIGKAYSDHKIAERVRIQEEYGVGLTD